MIDEHGFIIGNDVERLGFPDPSRVLWQGHPDWRDDPWGSGGLKVGGSGCPGCCIAEAQRRLGVNVSATPKTVLAAAAKASPPCFDPKSSNAYIARMARANKLKCADSPIEGGRGKSEEERVRFLRFAIARTIADGGVVMINVDKNKDGKPDHWICAYAITHDHVLCTDSATAKIERLSIETLRNDDMKWNGVPKPYDAIRVRPLTI